VQIHDLSSSTYKKRLPLTVDQRLIGSHILGMGLRKGMMKESDNFLEAKKWDDN
jgi:hypothetical protein